MPVTVLAWNQVNGVLMPAMVVIFFLCELCVSFTHLTQLVPSTGTLVFILMPSKVVWQPIQTGESEHTTVASHHGSGQSWQPELFNTTT